LAIGSHFHCEKYMCAHFLAVCHFNKGEWRECIDAGWRALRVDPRYAETHCLIADCYGELREYAYSRQWYRSALACSGPPPDAALFVDLSRYDDYPRRGIEICDRKLGEPPSPPPAGALAPVEQGGRKVVVVPKG
jgi:hypothetical protein